MSNKPLTRSSLHGVWPALITPWDASDQVDEHRLADEVGHFAMSGVHGVYTGGTTGEFYAQDDQTFDHITTVVCDAARLAGVPVQIGCTALSTRTACLRIRRAIKESADGIQLAIPFWLELKDDEVIAFFRAAADAAGETPLIIYHTGRSKRRLSPELIGTLAETFPSIVGMKDTVSDPTIIGQMLKGASDLAIFGAEHDLVAKTQAGTRGTYSSVTGLNARHIVSLYEACAAGNFDKATKLETPVARLMNEALIPMVRDEGLMDSAVDRVQRIVGGGDVGLACQGPYRSATPAHVQRLRDWCRHNTPELLSYSRESASALPRVNA